MDQFQLLLKRALDLLACLAILIVGMPLFMLIGVLVKLTSPGSVFFIQPRVGRNGKVFQLIKFRTMSYNHQQDAMTWTKAEDSRVTPFGRFLRDYGLDELPQLINIVKGDMSIIGPRPPLPAQVENYNEVQRISFRMRPGVLSLAAIKGRRGIPMAERINLHVKYVENWSLCRDIVILWRSLFVVLGKKNASELEENNSEDFRRVKV